MRGAASMLIASSEIIWPSLMIGRSSTKETDKSALVYARAWLRRSPGPDEWANLAAVYATKYRPDLKRARTWYWRAARRGHRRALFEYGLMLINGEGGVKRHRRGVEYLHRAAAMGDVNARIVLHRRTNFAK
jgi:TPR repeat protein